MKKITIDSNSILDASTKKTMSQVIDFDKEYVTTETDKDTTYKAGEGISITSDNTISVASVEDEPAIEQADSTTAGIMKLYSETGSNSDGTMTQESITDELGNKAPLASPAFTGTPTAPTPSSSDTGSDRIATTAYVLSLLKNDPTIIDDILTALNTKVGSANPTFTGNASFKYGNDVKLVISPQSGSTELSTGNASSASFWLSSDEISMDGGLYQTPQGNNRRCGIICADDGNVIIHGGGLYFWDGASHYTHYDSHTKKLA